ncbi:hypothetical protein IQ264_24510 [Phormidium sp. LEGE 05292]|uniref:hypothetical protein n=1 Tax=[Phormidium] sp. LEGE 05292 TaxID=767427 RepID=UPI00187E1E7E|nr:hypothetical protein [Phormidium sp. LEGE 05292]MBE9228577.1 hypothetical protein [Phormidium sp. LEGE 05292]
MENDKQKMRQAAAEAFMASLGDFEDMFAESEEKSSPVSGKAKPASKKKEVDIFEEALADIEAFIEKRSPTES